MPVEGYDYDCAAPRRADVFQVCSVFMGYPSIFLHAGFALHACMGYYVILCDFLCDFYVILKTVTS